MLKKLLIFVFVCFTSAVHGEVHDENNFTYQMPILKKTPVDALTTATPIPQRGEEYRKYLAASVQIFAPEASARSDGKVWGSSGSGTIVYFDSQKNLAYVATCGHLWNRGIMSAEEGKRLNKKCKVTIWYQNDNKLDNTRTYAANVIFSSYIDGQDTALITFVPDWEPNYFPIAPADYVYKSGVHAHSTGCDGSKETAHYDVELIGIGGSDLVTKNNSPRPGRSGGGLMDDEGYYIATCWGTEYEDGSGRGFFTKLSTIHAFWKQQGYEFLLNQRPSGMAQKLIVIDRNSIQGVYKPEYILMPKR